MFQINKLIINNLSVKIIFIIIILSNLNINSSASQGTSQDANASPVALVADAWGTGVYVAEYLPKRLVHITLSNGQEDWSASLPASPTSLVADVVRGRLYVTLDGSPGKVMALDAGTGRILFSVVVGHSPAGLALNLDGKLLSVCNRFNNSVSLIDIEKHKEITRIDVSREPVASAFTPDGRRLVVVNHLPEGPANDDYIAAMVSLVDPVNRTVVANLALPNGSTFVRGVAISPDGVYAYVTHSLGRYQVPTTQVERGWMSTSAISILDLSEDKLFGTFLLDDIDLGAANPWGVACTPDGRMLCVTHAGTHELSIINRVELHDRLSRIEQGEKIGMSQTLEDVLNDLRFLSGIRRRIPLSGNGSRELCLVRDQAVVGLYFSDKLSVISLKGEASPRLIALGTSLPLSNERTGEMFFNDATLCFQHWQSCASCHARDARIDGLNWDLLNDGIGNPKNTKTLLLTHKTPPAMSLGIRKNAEEAVRSGFRHIQFVFCSEENARNIDAYLMALQPISSPHLEKGKLSKSALRGEKVFMKAGCVFCHPAPMYTDLKQYNVGLGEGIEKNKVFDTPSLIECWRTAPYLHDGRAATLNEVLIRCNENDNHGSTSRLTPSEVNDLIKYVLSL